MCSPRLRGYAIVAVGIISAAAIANGFVGYLQVFVEIPTWIAICGLVVILGMVAAWGINESVKLATFITLLELGGLLIVLFSAGDVLVDLPEKLPLMLPTADTFGL